MRNGNVRFVVRFRPFDKEKRAAETPRCCPKTWYPVGSDTLTFEEFINHDASQEEVYNCVGKPMVVDAMAGDNATIITYGQPKSGKTYTMEGDCASCESCGIIPRAMADIFTHINSVNEDMEFSLKISFLEVYMDNVRDLLVNSDNPRLQKYGDGITQIKEATEGRISSPIEVLTLLKEGRARRRANSHSILVISINQKYLARGKEFSGRLCFVDLAGTNKTVNTNSDGTDIDEIKCTEKSLAVLESVIYALVNENSSDISYRYSALTYVLQDFLSSNAHITIVICCSLSTTDEAATTAALGFGRCTRASQTEEYLGEELDQEKWKCCFAVDYTENECLNYKTKDSEMEVEGWHAANNDVKLQGETQQAVPDGNIPLIGGLQGNKAETQYYVYVGFLKNKVLKQADLILSTQLENESLVEKITQAMEESEHILEEVSRLLEIYEDLSNFHDWKWQEFAAKLNAKVQSEKHNIPIIPFSALLELRNSSLEQKLCIKDVLLRAKQWLSQLPENDNKIPTEVAESREYLAYKRGLAMYRDCLRRQQWRIQCLTESTQKAELRKSMLQNQTTLLSAQLNLNGGLRKSFGDMSCVEFEFRARIKDICNVHRRQISALDAEIKSNQHEISELRKAHKQLLASSQTMSADFEKFKRKRDFQMRKMQTLYSEIRSGRTSFEESMAKEFRMLQQMVNVKTEANEKQTNWDEGEEMQSLMHEIAFLQERVNMLMKMHRLELRQNINLRFQHKNLLAYGQDSRECIAGIETALTEALQNARNTRKSYLNERVPNKRQTAAI